MCRVVLASVNLWDRFIRAQVPTIAFMTNGRLGRALGLDSRLECTSLISSSYTSGICSCGSYFTEMYIGN